MPWGWRSEQLPDPPWKMKNLTTLAIPILLFLCKGIWCKGIQGFTLTAPASVTVQQGLYVHIPCQFTYRHSYLNEKLSAYWFKNKERSVFCFDGVLHRHCVPGLLVATNDDRQTIERSAENRFHLTGDSNRGDCSFSIIHAQAEDEGNYYFRIIGNRELRFSYSTEFHYTSPHVSVADQNQDIEITMNLTSLRPADSLPGKGEGISGIVVARAGVSINLLCHMDGSPDPFLIWMKGDNIWAVDNVLQLTKITKEDAGEYQCQAENQHGSAKQAVWVIVQYAPELSRNPQRNTTCWHQENSFLCNCSLKAQPPAQIQWQVDGEIITEDNRENLKVTSFIQGNEVTSSFNWTVSMEVDHTILCIGSNFHGVYTVQFLLSALRDSSTTDSSPGIPNEIPNANPGHFSTAIFFLLGLIKILFCFSFFFCTFLEGGIVSRG